MRLTSIDKKGQWSLLSLCSLQQGSIAETNKGGLIVQLNVGGWVLLFLSAAAYLAC